MNCSLPSMETALLEKLQRTYMLAAKWKREKWLNVERIIGEQRVPAGGQQTTVALQKHSTSQQHVCFRYYEQVDSLDAGLEVKYFIMVRCRDGTLQQQNTIALAAMIPGKKKGMQTGKSELLLCVSVHVLVSIISPVTVRWPSLRLFHHWLIWNTNSNKQ